MQVDAACRSFVRLEVSGTGAGCHSWSAEYRFAALFFIVVSTRGALARINVAISETAPDLNKVMLGFKTGAKKVLSTGRNFANANEGLHFVKVRLTDFANLKCTRHLDRARPRADAACGGFLFYGDQQITHSHTDCVSAKSVPLVMMNAIIETPRLILRHFVESDLDLLAGLMADPDFMRFSNGIFSREQTANFLFDRIIAPAQQEIPSQFGVIFREENRLIGYCGFFRQLVDGVEEIEIGYRLHPDYWNRGLATEGARAVRDYAFNVLRLPRVISLIHPQNHASRRVTEKNGMLLEKETVFRGFPTLVFACKRDQFLSTES